VAIESDLADGRGWTHVTDTTVGVDGHFSVQVEPKGSGSYRAVSGEDTSPPVDLLVLDRSVSASVRGGRITVGVSPASPGATVVLQLYLKEHFGWWPTVTRRLDKSSRASFRVATHRRVSARVLLTLPDGATPLAKSKLLKLNAH
jgi:hypothetical protein